MAHLTRHFEHLKIHLESIKSSTNNFADENCIGGGGFGKVYKGELVHSKGKSTVALKRLDPRFGQGNTEFWKEISMLSLYKHENIVSLLGFCDENNEKILIYEYASKGSLDMYLDNGDLSWTVRLKICIGAARGLAYLHNHSGTQQRVLHRDIKSSNILLDENWNPKISDLGLSKFGPANQKYTFLVSNAVGTIGYVDPVYVETGLLTKESDVYSFGVVLFEVFCGRLCISNKAGIHQSLVGLVRQYYVQNRINEIICSSIKEGIHPKSLQTFTTIAYLCLKRDLEDRPLMTDVVKILECALEYQKGNEQEHAREREGNYHGHTREKEKKQERHIAQPEENVTTQVTATPMDIDRHLTYLPPVFPNSDVTILEGHTSSVNVCAWSPTGSLLASGSRDSTARIWTIGDGPCSSNSRKVPLDVAVLNHFEFALDWNGKGTLLATGCYDGQARIWSKDGELMRTFIKHKEPIICLKWNKRGDYLLSGSMDKTAIVWDIKTWQWRQQFEFHATSILDVDWCNDDSFATCATDNMIYVCKVGDNQPLKTFVGHQGVVNAIKWDPTGTLLASCSDDSTAKIWSIKQDACVHDLKDHRSIVRTIRWSRTGPGTNNPNQPLVLASASLDSTVKLWDVETGSLLHSLVAHEDSVTTIAFSPNGEYLASGSLDKRMHIWSVKEAKVVKTYVGSGWIIDVCWNKEGDKISVGSQNNMVCVIDFRM